MNYFHHTSYLFYLIIDLMSLIFLILYHLVIRKQTNYLLSCFFLLIQSLISYSMYEQLHFLHLFYQFFPLFLEVNNKSHLLTNSAKYFV